MFDNMAVVRSSRIAKLEQVLYRICPSLKGEKKESLV